MMYDYIVVPVTIVVQENLVQRKDLFLLQDIMQQKDRGNDVILIVWFAYQFRMKFICTAELISKCALS